MGVVVSCFKARPNSRGLWAWHPEFKNPGFASGDRPNERKQKHLPHAAVGDVICICTLFPGPVPVDKNQCADAPMSFLSLQAGCIDDMMLHRILL